MHAHVEGNPLYIINNREKPPILNHRRVWPSIKSYNYQHYECRDRRYICPHFDLVFKKYIFIMLSDCVYQFICTSYYKFLVKSRRILLLYLLLELQLHYNELIQQVHAVKACTYNAVFVLETNVYTGINLYSRVFEVCTMYNITPWYLLMVHSGAISCTTFPTIK